MEALKLTRNEYFEGLEKATKAAADNTTYLDKFEISFPDGLNTASALEICRIMGDADLDAKIRLAKICVAGKNVEVKCPNGEVEKFHLNSPTDSFDAFPLFNKEPLALLALSDTIYGYVLKKSLRLSTPKVAAQVKQM